MCPTLVPAIHICHLPRELSGVRGRCQGVQVRTEGVSWVGGQTLRENWLYARIFLQLNTELVEKWATPTFLLVMDINQNIFSQSSKRT
jgi:hypothetical protein